MNTSPQQLLDEKFDFVSHWFHDFQKVHKSIKEEIEKIRMIPPDSGRNFDVQHNQNHLACIHTHNGQILDIDSFLPKGYTLIPDTSFFINKKEIHFNVNELGYRGFLLSLFHEIGHAVHGDTTENTHLFESIVAIFQAITRWSIHSLIRSKSEFHYEMKDCVPLWYLKKTYQMISKLERKAWAYALTQLRELERLGWDVLSGFQNIEEIDDYISYSLISYELTYKFRSLYNLEFQSISSYKPINFVKITHPLRQKFTNILDH